MTRGASGWQWADPWATARFSSAASSDEPRRRPASRRVALPAADAVHRRVDAAGTRAAGPLAGPVAAAAVPAQHAAGDTVGESRLARAAHPDDQPVARFTGRVRACAHAVVARMAPHDAQRGTRLVDAAARVAGGWHPAFRVPWAEAHDRR